MTASWLKTNLEPQDLSERLDVNGRTITVYLSPYDVPRAIRPTVDGEILRLEFDYPGGRDEPSRCESFGAVTFCFGAKSGRLMKIEADGPSLDRSLPGSSGEPVQLRLSGVIRSAVEQRRGAGPDSRLEAAMKALDRTPGIYDALVPS